MSEKMFGDDPRVDIAVPERLVVINGGSNNQLTARHNNNSNGLKPSRLGYLSSNVHRLIQKKSGYTEEAELPWCLSLLVLMQRLLGPATQEQTNNIGTILSSR